MSTKKRHNQVQPLLYIDNPNHSMPTVGDNELELLYKRTVKEHLEEIEEKEPVKELSPTHVNDELVSEQNDVSEEVLPDSNEDEVPKKRSFDLNRHLGPNWQKSIESPNSKANEILRDAIEERVRKTNETNKKEVRTSEEKTHSRKSSEQLVQPSRKKGFENRSTEDKVRLLYKMRTLNPTVCICQTKEETWVGNVTDIEEDQFTMQTQQLPYQVTIRYEDVIDLTLDHFSSV
ncbi:CotO family spore coat protein [Geomicrobium sp. JCM 19038]|uniref:CotO family spore coat protein n=1 Tax=Geomicrobium sp. JCM 19038 TaxID=1460635 RepID=UPI00045F400A|nr:CotO family spore coat protein [Geomicrobium sp. JCM 19038]GAK10157.1 hypothetical protein JCM19038_4043 [Geomicrobium sp. JCM 19038]